MRRNLSEKKHFRKVSETFLKTKYLECKDENLHSANEWIEISIDSIDRNHNNVIINRDSWLFRLLQQQPSAQ